MAEIVGKIHSVETLGALDGEGIRTVFFLQGCIMRCKFCHNPDTWDFLGASQNMTPSQLVSFAKRYKNYYGEQGGVTLSGGEPLCQEDFCEQTINLLHANGINVAIDTGGSIFAPKILDIADLIILDIKHADAQKFIALTGVDNGNLLKTLEYLKTNKKKFWARHVVVPSITDSDAEIIQFKKMAEGASKIELLPYHTLGVLKWQSLGIDYPLKGVLPPTSQRMQELNKLLAKI